MKGIAERNRYWKATSGFLLAAWLLTSCQPLHISKALQDGRPLGEGAAVRATLQRPGAGSLPVQVGTPLSANDLLTTQSGTFVELLDPSGTRILVYPRTTVEISSIWVHIGKIFVSVRGAFRTGDRDESVAGAEGTSYFVRVEDNGAPASYTVIEGGINIRSRTNAWPPYPVRGPAACRVWRGAAPTGRNLTQEEQNRFIQEVNTLRSSLPGAADRLTPSVIGLNEGRAAATLRAQGLSVDQTVRRAARPPQIGKVVGQSPAPGEPLRAGQGVGLEIGAADAPPARDFPDVRAPDFSTMPGGPLGPPIPGRRPSDAPSPQSVD